MPATLKTSFKITISTQSPCPVTQLQIHKKQEENGTVGVDDRAEKTPFTKLMLFHNSTLLGIILEPPQN